MRDILNATGSDTFLLILFLVWGGTAAAIIIPVAWMTGYLSRKTKSFMTLFLVLALFLIPLGGSRDGVLKDITPNDTEIDSSSRELDFIWSAGNHEGGTAFVKTKSGLIPYIDYIEELKSR